MEPGALGRPATSNSQKNLATGDITRWLLEWNQGNAQALSRLIPLVYEDLRRIAARCLRQEMRDHTLEPAGLIHEAYLKFSRQEHLDWHDRAHFFNTSARVMRQILIDHARRRNYLKRGGEFRFLSIDEVEDLSAASPLLIVIDEALTHLSRTNPESGQIVELRLFGGLSHEEVADTLQLSVRTVKRRWRLARAWLHRYLTQQSTP